jgi:WD40 repeat protein
VLSWSDDGTMRLWDATAGACVRVFEGHQGRIVGVSRSATGRLLSWGADRTIRLWRSDDAVALATLPGNAERILGAVELADGSILSWSTDFTLRLWDGWVCDRPSESEPHFWPIAGLLRLSNGNVVSVARASGIMSNDEGDSVLQVWDSRTGTLAATLAGHTGPVHHAHLVGIDLVLSWGRAQGNDPRLWSGISGECLFAYEGAGSVKAVFNLPDGRPIFLSSCDTLVDVGTGAVLGRLPGPSPSDIRVLPHGRLLCWSDTGPIRVFSCVGHRDGEELTPSLEIPSVYERLTVGVELLPNGDILSASLDGTLLVWNGASGALRTTLVNSLGFLQSMEAWGCGESRSEVIIHIESVHAGPFSGVWDYTTGALVRPYDGTRQARASDRGDFLPDSEKPLALVADEWRAGENRGRCHLQRQDDNDGSALVWHGDAAATSRVLDPDGTVIVSCGSRVACLKLRHGGCRVTLGEASSLLRAREAVGA